MPAPIHVSMGDLYFSNDSKQIVTFVGSCVALCMYSKEYRCAGLAHIMLAGQENNRNSTTKSPAKYSLDAIDKLMNHFAEEGVEINTIRAKLVGGAQIFKHENGNGLFNIGKKNIDSIRIGLYDQGIPIESEDLGASYGRWVYLDSDSGIIEVKGKKGGCKKL